MKLWNNTRVFINKPKLSYVDVQILRSLKFYFISFNLIIKYNFYVSSLKNKKLFTYKFYYLVIITVMYVKLLTYVFC